MARLVKPLTVAQINNARPRETSYKLFDGGGLYLLITPAGGKRWKLKYRQANGKEGLLSFGPYPALSLEQARRKRDEAKSQIVSGRDPAEMRRQKKAEMRSQNTFHAITNAWLDLTRSKVAPQSLRNYKTIIDKYLLPPLGNMPIQHVRPGDYLDVLRIREHSPPVNYACGVAESVEALPGAKGTMAIKSGPPSALTRSSS